MNAGKPVTPADHIDRAKEQLANGVPDYAVANALIAIAELLAQQNDPEGRPIRLSLKGGAL